MVPALALIVDIRGKVATPLLYLLSYKREVSQL